MFDNKLCDFFKKDEISLLNFFLIVSVIFGILLFNSLIFLYRYSVIPINSYGRKYNSFKPFEERVETKIFDNSLYGK